MDVETCDNFSIILLQKWIIDVFVVFIITLSTCK